MTVYWVRLRVHATGLEQEIACDSMLERALLILSWSPYATVLEMGQRQAEEA